MIPKFASQQEFTDFFEKELKADKSRLYAMKKATTKEADAVTYLYTPGTGREDASKEEAGVMDEPETGKILVKSVINTTNLLDSHGDVHIKGLWKKSLDETKVIYLLQEHQMKFDKIITDEVSAYTKTLAWSALGMPYEGKTQALMFDSIVSKERNEFMFEQYRKGYVKNHSVGMRYVKIMLAYNSTEKYWSEEKATWDKYLEEVANKEAAEDLGYFWVVPEAKVIEGSAVVMGSNWATPTTSVTEAGKSTSDANNPSDEPPQGTPKTSYLDIAQSILQTQKQKA